MRIRLSAAVALVAATSLGLSACSSDISSDTAETGETIVVSHAQGETEVPVDPERVVVFDQSVLQSMIDLDLPDAVGVPALTNWPDSFARYRGDDVAKVGSLFEPDFEAVNALEPDLIIVAARSATSYDALSEIAPTVDLSVDSKDFLNSVEKQNRNLAGIFGAEDAFEAKFGGIRESFDAVSASAEQANLRGLILRVEAAEVTAYGPGSRYGIIHDLGVAPVSETFADDVAHGDAVSFEYIAQADPDLMFVQDREAPLGDTTGPNASRVLGNPLVGGTTAAEEGRITYLDLYTWYMAPSALSSVQSQIDVVGQAVGMAAAA
ncbi:siderophore ABC transporter substrate-binding protein [Rhodococcus rhodochrous]|uniref:ABC transporter substrate-binding protein n=1 Tax=Rhodococcus rhodochrous KG-21 TaxID=1441923 RepID=A0A0N0S0S8_RHORH|nr:ABC transporter substrate-binding protein [Rhodococcus rhodochrous]KOS55901.1 ABC transporter substrate-binding protein [Rhodococcus rhodochrous KG-21]